MRLTFWILTVGLIASGAFGETITQINNQQKADDKFAQNYFSNVEKSALNQEAGTVAFERNHQKLLNGNNAAASLLDYGVQGTLSRDQLVSQTARQNLIDYQVLENQRKDCETAAGNDAGAKLACFRAYVSQLQSSPIGEAIDIARAEQRHAQATQRFRQQSRQINQGMTTQLEKYDRQAEAHPFNTAIQEEVAQKTGTLYYEDQARMAAAFDKFKSAVGFPY
jgi:hypothetical protein